MEGIAFICLSGWCLCMKDQNKALWIWLAGTVVLVAVGAAS